jgi:hypothetical protein
MAMTILGRPTGFSAASRTCVSKGLPARASLGTEAGHLGQTVDGRIVAAECLLAAAPLGDEAWPPGNATRAGLGMAPLYCCSPALSIVGQVCPDEAWTCPMHSGRSIVEYV